MGGGNSGGGGSSGAVSYPAYMQAFHGLMLDSGGADTPTYSFMDLYNTATSGDSPFGLAVAYDPDANITNMDTSLSKLESTLNAMAYGTDWTNMASIAVSIMDAKVFSDSRIASEVAAFSAVAEDEVTTTILPRFQAGMRDAGAVLTSAYTIGQAIINAMKSRDINKMSADLYLMRDRERLAHMDAAIKDMAQMHLQHKEFVRAFTALSLEKERLAVVAYKEESDMNVKYDEADAKWDLECIQYGANLLAAIGGGTATTSNIPRSQTASVIGGALSGAAVGAGVGFVAGGSPGALVGAGVGALVGGFQASMS